MIMLQWCKMQIMSLLILTYIGITYINEGSNFKKITNEPKCNFIFNILFLLAELAILFDGITACTVNLLDQIPKEINLFMHLGMYIFYELFAITLFWYWVSSTIGILKEKWVKIIGILPTCIIIFLTAYFIGEIEFLHGKYTNYSMGNSVYICFISVAIYCALSLLILIIKHRYITQKNKKSLFTVVAFIFAIFFLQIIFPESLISCVAAVMVMISIYLNTENSAIRGLEHYHREMVIGFATLVDNKDDDTGEHIKRSSSYAKLIAKNLRKNKKYKNVITKDYLDNLVLAAPMHDIGKIGIPDAILKKESSLTNEEYEKMKEHTIIGGKIIKDTFGHLYKGEYESMAFQVAMYHHEKWNGKGYPEGLSKTNIPLCARIMTVADVFDALSAKRCYKDALSLEDCYNIIKRGSGIDFDPDVVEAFLIDKNKIKSIYLGKKHIF